MKKLNILQLLTLNAYWVGLSFMWNALHPIILPAIMLNFVPDAQKNTYLGLLTFVGLILAMLVQPLSGALSDHWPSRWGRRRPLIVFGTLFDFIFLTILGWAGGLTWLFIGYIGEKRGTRAVMRLWGLMSFATPLLALALTLARPVFPASALMYAYALVFVIVGAQGNSLMAGFLNYVLESAPASSRTVYIGFANTASGISLVAPLIGGAILSLSSSYALLFVAAAVGPVAGLVLSLGLAEPRHHGVPTLPSST